MNEWTPAAMLILALGMSNVFMVGVSLTTNLLVSVIGFGIGLALAAITLRQGASRGKGARRP